MYGSGQPHGVPSCIHVVILNKAQHWAICCLLACSTASTGAEPVTELFDEADLLSDIPYVASATRLPQKITDAPASVTIIDRNIIDASGAVTVPDLFRLVPGMQSYSVTRNRNAVTHHGMSGPFPNRLEVMINGRSIYLPMLFTVDWGSIGISLDDIRHIEVIRGSNVPTFGSNALLGAINIVTKPPVEQSENSISAMTGANSTHEVQFRLGGLSGDNFSFQLAGGYSGNEGSARYRDGLQNRHLNGSAIYTPDLYSTLDLHFTFSDGYSEIGEADKADNQFTRREHQANSQHLTLHHLLDNQNELRVSFYHNQLVMETPLRPAAEILALEENIDLTLAQMILALNPIFQPLQGTALRQDNEHGKTDLYDLEFSHTSHLNHQLDLVWGAGYRFEKAISETLLQNNGWIDEHHGRLFGNLQWHAFHDWTFNVGTMIEKSSLISSARISPRIAANYHWDDYLTLRGAFTRAHRLPSLLERHGNFSILTNTGDPWDIISVAAQSVDSEDINSLELGLLQLWPGADAQLDLRIFYEEIEGGFDSHYSPLPSGSDIDDRARTHENVADWHNHGAELGWQWKYRPHSLMMLSYSYLDQSGVRNRGHRVAGDPDDMDSLTGRSPQHTLAALVNYGFENSWRLSLSHYLMSETVWLEGANFQKPRKTYQRTDMMLARSFQLKAHNTLDLSLSIQNLFDRQYSEFYEFNEIDRRIYLRGRLNF